jgi:CubicO group peptidase (beta-lactamase class C family)
MLAFSFPFSNPEEQGIPSSAVSRFVEAIEKKHIEMHSFILLRHGKQVASGWWDPYQPDLPHMLFSLSKSFTSSAVGMAVAEKLLSVEDAIVSFFPEELPPVVSENLKAMKIKHLLTMSTGHALDTTDKLHKDAEGNWVKCFLAQPVENMPGKPFVYNSGATYMLSAIVQKVTGMPVLEYLRPRLFEPLEIENPTWENCPRGINAGGWGLSIRTEDIARFGQLYLNKGIWNGKRILAEEWIEQATCAQVSNGDNPESDWTQGYGYQFWRCRHGAYRGDGAFGQYCVVIPEQDAVLAITSGLGDMQVVLNLVWKYLLGSMRNAPLRANPKAHEKLAQKLACLVLPEPKGENNSALEGVVSGKDFGFKKNIMGIQSTRFEFAPDHSCTYYVKMANNELAVQVGSGQWLQSATRLFSRSGAESLVKAQGKWIDGNTYVITLRYFLTPFSWTITSKFAEKTVTLRAVTNVSFGPTKLPRLFGKAN